MSVSEANPLFLHRILFLFFRLESVSPYLARQFVPYARTFMQEFVKHHHGDNNDEEIEDDIEEEEGQEDKYNENEEEEEVELLDTNGNKVYSAVQVEDLLSRCLAAISNRGSISSRYITLTM